MGTISGKPRSRFQAKEGPRGSELCRCGVGRVENALTDLCGACEARVVPSHLEVEIVASRPPTGPGIDIPDEMCECGLGRANSLGYCFECAAGPADRAEERRNRKIGALGGRARPGRAGL